MLVIIFAKYGKNPSRTVGAIEQTLGLMDWQTLRPLTSLRGYNKEFEIELMQREKWEQLIHPPC